MSAESTTRNVLLVTGVTGKVGYQAALSLLEKGLTIRVLLRTDGPRADELRKKGVDVVVGDLLSTADVRRAVKKDVKAALFVPSITLMMIQAAAVFAAAIEDSEVPYLTMMSQWYVSPDHPAVHTQQLWLAERIFLRLAPTTTVTRIRVGLFADNNLSRGLLANAIQTGQIPNFFADGRIAPISNEDLGASCAATLAECEKFGVHGIMNRPTGPKAMSFGEMLEVVSRVLGKPVVEMKLGHVMASKALTNGGLDWFGQQATFSYAEPYNFRAQEIVLPTDHVQYLTGRVPEEYETTVRRYADKEAKPSIGGTMKVVGNLVAIATSTAADIPKEMARVQIPLGKVEPLQSEDWKSDVAQIEAIQYLLK
ncbi:hypothetical protein HDU98_007393 [Podochytrium sp. JEL0797]|nr:hypothetical protein HDU98_007393 [Podochytrium sp. JEL0797]